MNDKIYTVEQVAEVLNSNSQTIRKLIRNKELNAVKKLNKYFIKHSDVLNYLEN
jgi:excisionase family DNA binding protein